MARGIEEKFDEDKVSGIVKKIEDAFNEFRRNTTKHTVKAQAQRARKLSFVIRDLMKEYRAASIKK